MRTLENLNFANSYARLPGDFHARLRPTPLQGAHLVSFNEAAGRLIELHPAEAQRDAFVHYLNGTAELPGSEPLAALYAGHQFGQFVPQLGDGRAILLGEVMTSTGERWELQLKGAGQTPFSRQGDGRAVLRSTIREYLCSEAMHGLGIPTTRALCILGSSEEVYREAIETGALLLRMAPSHLRFGSFEVFYHRNQLPQLRQLADYALEHHYPHLRGEADPVFRLFEEVIERTARLISQWQQVGFAHGVMNTDNMSLLGLTLDYGPFGFLDSYEPGYICNHSDYQGRYAFKRQPNIGRWNLSRLGQALLPLFEGELSKAAGRANAALQAYDEILNRHYHQGMQQKLGLQTAQPQDPVLISDLLALLAANRVDYTRFFRGLGKLEMDTPANDQPLRDMFIDREAFDAWAARYRERLHGEASEDTARRRAMDAVNPKYILRNHLAQIAIDKAEREQDYSEIDRLLQLLREPFSEQPEHEAYADEPPAWAQAIEISCSS